MMVAHTAGADYAFVHHWNNARRLGIPPEKLARLADYESSPLFDEQERTVIRYAAEATRNVAVSDATFSAVRGFLDNRRLMELILNVASYNLIVRVLLPTGVELEPDLKAE
ncbi:MAG: carboxymuconolactone decarboxylase family protein [Candidatus Binataceae bacterium]